MPLSSKMVSGVPLTVCRGFAVWSSMDLPTSRREYTFDFIGKLEPGNRGFDLPISDFILRSRLAKEDLNLIRDTLREWSDGSSHLGLSATL